MAFFFRAVFPTWRPDAALLNEIHNRFGCFARGFRRVRSHGRLRKLETSFVACMTNDRNQNLLYRLAIYRQPNQYRSQWSQSSKSI